MLYACKVCMKSMSREVIVLTLFHPSALSSLLELTASLIRLVRRRQRAITAIYPVACLGLQSLPSISASIFLRVVVQIWVAGLRICSVSLLAFLKSRTVSCMNSHAQVFCCLRWKAPQFVVLLFSMRPGLSLLKS